MILAGAGLLIDSCVAGFVVTEPPYVEFERPQPPGNLYIWIEGDWVWDRQNHVYVRRNGYWAKPIPGWVFAPGHWQATPRGKYWEKGHWEKQKRRDEDRNR